MTIIRFKIEIMSLTDIHISIEYSFLGLGVLILSSFFKEEQLKKTTPDPEEDPWEAWVNLCEDWDIEEDLHRARILYNPSEITTVFPYPTEKELGPIIGPFVPSEFGLQILVEGLV